MPHDGRRAGQGDRRLPRGDGFRRRTRDGPGEAALTAFPLTLKFRILTLGQRIDVVDADGMVLCHVLQKAFRLKEDVVISSGAALDEPMYRIRADRIIDIGGRYRITDPRDEHLGTVAQRGMRSFWRATYDISDAGAEPVALVHEENPWVKVLDGLIGALPLVGLVLQMLVSPSYIVESPVGTPTLRIRKQRSLIERRFIVDKLGEIPPRLERLMLPGLLMVTLLERGRG